MKKNLETSICLLMVLLVAASCKKAVEDVLSTEIPVKDQSVTFVLQPANANEAPARVKAESEEVLYDGVLKINIAAELESRGFSFENIKSFLITQGTLEETTPDGFDMKGFIGAKLYFDNRDQLVAKVDKVEKGIARFTIVNPQLLDKLENDELHIILVGVRPSIQLKLTLKMDYLVKVSLIK